MKVFSIILAAYWFSLFGMFVFGNFEPTAGIVGGALFLAGLNFVTLSIFSN